MALEANFDKHLNLWSIFLTGALTKITNKVWDVQYDRDMWDFCFSCRLGEYVRGTRSFDFVSTKNIHGQLLLDACNIASLAQHENKVGDIDLNIVDSQLMKELMEEIVN